jgi:predicted nuclease with RNAse H fold
MTIALLLNKSDRALVFRNSAIADEFLVCGVKLYRIHPDYHTAKTLGMVQVRSQFADKVSITAASAAKSHQSV